MIGERILNYQIESLIGEGGVGSVYLATHIQLGRKVAIKVLNPHLVNNPEIKERFKNEAATLSSLQHINIVTLYDYLEEERGLFLIMEYAPGHPLDEYIRKTSGPIPEQKTVFFFNQILDGFAYAHNQGIIHRDIKPSNIIITFDADIKILDFGIAKILKEGRNTLTKTGTKLGTVLYMSPEQVQGKSIDKRTDIYSLGITLFQMLTGRCPYDEFGSTEYQVYEKIINEPLPSAKSFYPAVSDRMQAIIDKATAKNPEERFQSCEEFKQVLNSMLSYSPLSTTISFQTETQNQTKTQNSYQNENKNKSNQPTFTKSEPKQKRSERSFMLLYIILGILIFTSVGILIYEFTRTGTDSNKEELVKKKDTSEDESDDFSEEENTEEVKEEKTPEEILLDSLEEAKKKTEDFIELLNKERKNELLKFLPVDAQFESNEFDEFIIQVSIANQKKDVKFKDIIIVVTYYDEEGKEVGSKEQELEPLSAGQNLSFKLKANVKASKFECRLKSAEPIEEEVPKTLDSLNKELEKINEKIKDLKKEESPE